MQSLDRSDKSKLTSKRYKLISPEGIEYVSAGNLISLCKELNLSYSTLHKNINKGKIKTKRTPYKDYSSPDGWEIIDLTL